MKGEATSKEQGAVESQAQPRAVIYLRVSTNKQADKDIDPEGYSLPAQRESCYRKAEQLGVEVVDEYERLDQERVHAERVLDTVMVVWERIEGTLTQALEFIGHCDEVYRRGGTRIRRLANQALFEKLLVHDETVAGAILREPWATLVTTEFIEQMASNTKNPDRLSSGRGVKTGSLVPPAGLEPAARCLEGSRSIQLSYRGWK